MWETLDEIEGALARVYYDVVPVARANEFLRTYVYFQNASHLWEIATTPKNDSQESPQEN